MKNETFATSPRTRGWTATAIAIVVIVASSGIGPASAGPRGVQHGSGKPGSSKGSVSYSLGNSGSIGDGGYRTNGKSHGSGGSHSGSSHGYNYLGSGLASSSNSSQHWSSGSHGKTQKSPLDYSVHF